MAIKICIEDGLSVGKGTGIGQHTLNLFHQLGELSEVDSVQLLEKPFLARVPSALRRVLYIAWLNSGLQLSLRRRKVDIVHFTNFLIPAVRLSKAKYVVTIHDLTPWRFPETLPSTYLLYIKPAVSYAAKYADLIVTDLDIIQEEIIERFKVGGERVCTVYSGIAKDLWELPKKDSDCLAAVKEKFGIKKNFLLFVGTIEERKNVMTLVKAFEGLRERKDLQLVLVGRPGYGFSKLSEYLEENHLKGEVILTGYVTEEEKIALYDSATIFVYPSLYEGFGIPLVEAMVRKVPIVASKIPSTEELASEAALYYDNPFDHAALAERVLGLFENDLLQQDLVKKGLKRAQEFSWKKMARKHLEAYQKLLGTKQKEREVGR